jgi:phytoene synthase
MRLPRRAGHPADSYLPEAQEVMENAARTFSLAARLLPATVRDDVVLLYLVLRTLDDLVDERSPEAAAAIAAVETWLVTGETSSRETTILADLTERYGLPRPALVAFLQGMRDDLEPPQIETEGDLDVYCYRVAGCVGEMMASILGVWDEAAWGCARALGNAMQRTNILRDVDEDLAGVPMLVHGGRSVAAAGAMYREILREIERRGYGARRDRSVVSRPRKARIVAAAFIRPGRWS